jgi:hypothetical protein
MFVGGNVPVPPGDMGVRFLFGRVGQGFEDGDIRLSGLVPDYVSTLFGIKLRIERKIESEVCNFVSSGVFRNTDTMKVIIRWEREKATKREHWEETYPTT